MSDFDEFYKIGKLTGLSRQEIDRTRRTKNYTLIAFLTVIIFFAIISIISTIIISHTFVDPYAAGTAYGVIEPKFVRRIRKKLIGIKIL